MPSGEKMCVSAYASNDCFDASSKIMCASGSPSATPIATSHAGARDTSAMTNGATISSNGGR
jgi:hypothetical protein